jgi:hypothetical protein
MEKKKTVTKKSRAKIQPNEVEMKNHLINKYREVVGHRYLYENVKKNPGLPPEINKEIVETLRLYFLNNLYPVPEQRDKLDAAFAELENYVMHPSKVWDLLGKITNAIFRFGLQFPAAARAGLSCLEAYTSAKHFENTLTRAALDKGFTVPVSDEQFYECLVAIPKPELDNFISELENLFESFTNTSLLGKTISIMEDIVKQMKGRTDLYGPNEVEAIELGLDIMRKGYDLFINFDENMKQQILDFISTNEKNFINSLYNRK